jgi:S1-C subfamily serine protease
MFSMTSLRHCEPVSRSLHVPATIRVLAFLAVIVTIPGTTHADTSINAFDEAQRYTAEVRTSVPSALAFENDDPGTFLGAGFLVRKDQRWLVTNAHVVARAPSRVDVAFRGYPYRPARKVYVDPMLDIAILELAIDGLPNTATEGQMECAATPTVGQQVGAFGHPAGSRYIGTRGIFSGHAPAQDGVVMLQTDATIDIGHSGGPLIDLRTGRIVGVNAYSRRNVPKANFAVPSPYVCAIVEHLLSGRDPTPPEIPIIFFADPRQERPLTVVQSDSPTQWPLRPDDQVLGIRGTGASRIDNVTELINGLRGKSGAVRLLVRRNGTPVEIEVQLTPGTPVLTQKALLAAGAAVGASAKWALLNRDLGSVLHVLHVLPGSTANHAGLQSGDAVISINGRSVATLEEVISVVAGTRDGNIRIHVRRLAPNDQLFAHHLIELEVRDIQSVRFDSPELLVVDGTKRESEIR